MNIFNAGEEGAKEGSAASGFKFVILAQSLLFWGIAEGFSVRVRSSVL